MYWQRFQLLIALISLMEFQQLQTAPMASSEDSTPPPKIEELENYYNGIDIDDENAELKTRNAVNSKMQRWPQRKIFYVISKDYTDEEANNVRKALETFNQRTCLDFEELNEINIPQAQQQQQFIYYKKSPKMCGTQVGYNPMAKAGTEHPVMLTEKCLSHVGIIQHESMHVLGLYHEQSRYDRDRYIRIIYSNIPTKYQTQFVMYPPIYTRTFNIPYDYESLMHYPSNAFASDPTKPTMRAIDAQGKFIERKMGQLNGPSVGDLKKINLMYDCVPVSGELD